MGGGADVQGGGQNARGGDHILLWIRGIAVLRLIDPSFLLW